MGCPSKVATLREAPHPQTPKDLQRFLGLASYYEHLVPHFATLAASLTDLTHGKGKGKAWDPPAWTDRAESTFQCLKQVLCTPTLLQRALLNQPFIVYTDTSDVGLCEV